MGVRERASRLAGAQRSERSCGHWFGGLGSRRRPAGARTLVQPERAEEPGLCPELGGNVGTGPRLGLAHCGDLAFPGRERAPQREGSGDRGLFAGPRGAPQGARNQYCSRARRGAGAPSRRWSPGCKKREAPPPGLERGATGSGDPGRRTEPSPAPRLRGTSFGSIVPARTRGAGRRAPPGIESRPRGSRGPARSPGAAGRSRGRGHPPARTSHGGLSRGGTAAPSES